MIQVILTCYNRREKTINCIKKLKAQNVTHDMKFIVVDDNSEDGTREAIETLNYDVKILIGNGNLYWAGGMRIGIQYYLDHKEHLKAEYILLVNDDVDFYPGTIEKMIDLSKRKMGAVIAGNCCDQDGNHSYGAVNFSNNIFKDICFLLAPYRVEKKADTFNCNCVLMEADIMNRVGNFDSMYTHNFADYDYGMTLNKFGYEIYGTSFYVGVCSDNSISGTWQDKSLSIKERLKRKEWPKGLPQKEWSYFLLKNFGVIYWIRYGYTGVIKILLGM